jgi:hypothetical protein
VSKSIFQVKKKLKIHHKNKKKTHTHKPTNSLSNRSSLSNFLKSNLSGVHPLENLAKSGHKPDMKHNFLIFLLYLLKSDIAIWWGKKKKLLAIKTPRNKVFLNL